MAANLVFHARAKYIDLDYHFVRKKVVAGAIQTHYLPSSHQLAGVFMKPLARQSYTNFCFMSLMGPDKSQAQAQAQAHMHLHHLQRINSYIQRDNFGHQMEI